MPESLTPFIALQQVLDAALASHQQRCEVYRRAMQACADARVMAVLQHLLDSEQQLAAAIARYRDSGDDVLDTVVQGVPAAALSSAQQPVDGNQDIDRLLHEYRARDGALLLLYEQLHSSLIGPRARAIIADLIGMERRNQQRLQAALLDF